MLAVSISAQCASVPEAIEVPAIGLSSSPGPLRALLFKPAPPAPRRAVVLMHGCSGAYSRNGALSPRHQMWSEFLQEHGYVVLMLDSFTSRGVRELCTQKFAERSLREADRVGDAYAALAYLRSRADVSGPIAIMGWSHGGGATLSTISQRPGSGAGYAAAVSFYPGCSAKSKSPEKFRPYSPLLLLMGEADDWTPVAPCKALAAAVAARGDAMRIVTYPGAYHDFDNPGLAVTRVRTEVPNGANPGRGVTVGPDPKAREDAKKQVLQFLTQHLK